MTSIFDGLPVAGAAASPFDSASARRTSNEAFDRYIEAVHEDLQLHFWPQHDTAEAREIMQNALPAETAVLAQEIAQEGGDADGDAAAAGPDEGAVQRPDPVQVFLDYMAKTPEERYFDSFLKSKGLTEESFEALPAEERQALMREFEELVKTRIEKQAAENPAEPQAPGVM